MMKNQTLSERVQSIPPSGIRVIFDKVQKMRDIIGFEVGEPDFETPPHIKEAATKALEDNATHYTASAGLFDLREAIASKLRRDNSIDAEASSEIVVTSGACSAVYLTFTSILNSGDEVLIPDPCWPHYEPCITLAGGTPVPYSLDEENDFRANGSEIRSLVTPRTKAILINSPSNPTGGAFLQQDIEEIADIAVEKDLLVISDEVYEKILYDGISHTSIASLKEVKDRTITINALSKTYAMTGWRVGYAVAKPEIISQLVKLNLYTNTCANSIAQRAGIAALTGSQDRVDQMVREYSKRRGLIVKRLNEIEGFKCKKPLGAFYVFPDIKEIGFSSFDCSMFFLDNARVSTVPGISFGRRGEGHIRLSYAISQEKIDEGMNRIAECVAHMKTKQLAA